MNQAMTAMQAEIEIHKLVAAYWSLIVDMYPSIGTAPRIMVTTRKSRVAGYAWKSKVDSRVEYNLTFVLTAGMEVFTELLVHELAHIVQFRIFPNAPQVHGPEFRYVMRRLGYVGDTYHYMDVVEAKAASKAAKSSSLSIAGIL
jgi:predicted SprT family Zn-dependent metalloprotease